MKKTFFLNLNKKSRYFFVILLSFSVLLSIFGLSRNSQAAGGAVSSNDIYCGATLCGKLYSIFISAACTKAGTESTCGSLSCECSDTESVTLPNTGTDSTLITNFSISTNPGICTNVWPITSDGTIFGKTFSCTNNTCNINGGIPSGRDGNVHGSVASQCFGSGGGFGVGAGGGYKLTDCFANYTASSEGVCTAALPAPTASLTVSGGGYTNATSITVPSGTYLTYSKSSTNAGTDSGTYSTPSCGSGAWGVTDGPTAPSQVGCGAWTLTYKATNSSTGKFATASVSVTVIAAPMSGTLSASPSSCTIASGASSCTVNLTWSTTNPVGTSAVTASGMTSVNGNNGGPTAFAVPYSSRTFYLYNNAVLLAQTTVTASCVGGASWNGSSCAVAVLVPALSALWNTNSSTGQTMTLAPGTYTINFNFSNSGASGSIVNVTQCAGINKAGNFTVNLPNCPPITLIKP